MGSFFRKLEVAASSERWILIEVTLCSKHSQDPPCLMVNSNLLIISRDKEVLKEKEAERENELCRNKPRASTTGKMRGFLIEWIYLDLEEKEREKGRERERERKRKRERERE